VPDEDLTALYASCSAFVYPSFYEGWGLPVAEAMSLGAPAITSNVSSLPEVAGEAALLVDPYRADEVADALERVLTDGELAARLRVRGPAQARLFTTHACAAATLQVYRAALET
jgi:alpha-1,3-rhamnosyl/mannosyltransferase